MNIGQAIEAMREGRMVRREGWNGKGMHIYLEDSFHFAVMGGVHSGAVREYEPMICMYTAQGKHQPGWLASQADLLADDWVLVTE